MSFKRELRIRNTAPTLVLSLDITLVTQRVGRNLLVITLQSSQILTSLGELAFLHTLTNVPVDEGTLGVHEIELGGQSRPSLSNGSGVGKHAANAKLVFVIHLAERIEINLHSTVNLGQVAVGDHAWGLEADTELEASRAPVDKLDGALGLKSSNSGVSVLGDNVTSVQQASCHVLSVPGVALDHLVVGLEARHGHLLDGVGLVGSLGSRDDWCVSNQREVDAGVRDKVGLEFVQIDVEGAIETERGSDGRDHYEKS